MPSLRPALLATAAVLAILAGVVLYFSYGVDDAPPARATVVGLAEPATVTWHPDGVTTIRAPDAAGRHAALGYAHGLRDGWPLLLWRQAALGRLSAWYGTEAQEADALTLRLGLAEDARTAYAALDDSLQQMLTAYGHGLDAALQSEALRQREEVALLDLHPAPWEAWHALAVERLVAWLAASPAASPAAAPSAATLPDSARALLHADDLLREWLGLHGFEHSVAWAARDTAGAHVMHRIVYGDAALPLLHEVVLTDGQAPLVRGATLPGTPFFLQGTTGSAAWAVLPRSDAELVRLPFDSTARLSYDVVAPREASEHLVSARRHGDLLFLEHPAPIDTTVLPAGLDPLAYRAAVDSLQAAADTVWALRWNGLGLGTDAAAWQALAGGGTPSFGLFVGGGLHVGSDASWTVMGSPRVRAEEGDRLLVGNARWATFQAEVLREASGSGLRPERWMRSDTSAWAARLVPDMLAALDSLAALDGLAVRDSLTAPDSLTDGTAPPSTASAPEGPLLGEALTYLSNWNYVYDRASIGASVFDGWTRAYRRMHGRLPAPLAADTADLPESRRRLAALRRAVGAFADRYGTDLRRWRWERVAERVYRFPGWRPDSASRRRYDRMGRTRYAPIHLPGRGHPSAPSWGPSLADPARPAPAEWTAWMQDAPAGSLFVSRPHFDLQAVLGRYRIPHEPPTPRPLDAPSPGPTTTLLPPDGS